MLKGATSGLLPGLLLCATVAIGSPRATEPADTPTDLAGMWKIATTRGQVGQCGAASVDNVGRVERGRVTTHQGRARIEPAEDGSWWIRRLGLDGTPEPTVRWTAVVRPDGSVVSSLLSEAFCGDDPPRYYGLELEGALRVKKKGLRIELKGTDVVCPDMGCSFKVTHVLTREKGEGAPSD